MRRRRRPTAATTNEDTPVAINVVANDTDVDGDTLTPSTVSAPDLGSVAIAPDGTVVYTPPPNYSGPDSFTYTVSDGHGGTASAAVSITIASVNDAPTATPKTATTKYQTAVTIALTGADVETCNLTFQIVTPPAHGTLESLSSVLCVTLLPPYSDSVEDEVHAGGRLVGRRPVHVSDLGRCRSGAHRRR